MRLVWTTSWLRASLLGACLFLANSPAHLSGGDTNQKGRNELRLARLRPGQDTLARAVTLYGSNYRRVNPDSDDVLAWVDRRGKCVLRIELGEEQVIQSVTVSAIDPLLDDDTGAQTSLPAQAKMTGLGLALGHSRARVRNLYGAPGSRGPSTQQGRELELFFYAFDWAGSDVPQVMEVTCDRASGRVVQITLAFPSL